jgi:hypothetical protein
MIWVFLALSLNAAELLGLGCIDSFECQLTCLDWVGLKNETSGDNWRRPHSKNFLNVSVARVEAAAHSDRFDGEPVKFREGDDWPRTEPATFKTRSKDLGAALARTPKEFKL